MRKLQPAHGGSDPGKISTSGVMEKDVNLSIAMALKQLFENRGFTVVMTRTTDCDLAPDNSKHPKTDDLTKPRSIKPNKEYFILKKSTSPTVIVECGFLSNPAETLLLTDKNYQDDLAHAIYIGVTDYLAQSPSGHLQ